MIQASNTILQVKEFSAVLCGGLVRVIVQRCERKYVGSMSGAAREVRRSHWINLASLTRFIRLPPTDGITLVRWTTASQAWHAVVS